LITGQYTERLEGVQRTLQSTASLYIFTTADLMNNVAIKYLERREQTKKEYQIQKQPCGLQ
jgi:hypothetical protein